MVTRSTLTLKLSPATKSFIERRTEFGGYDSTSDFVESLVREYVERENQSRLEQLLLEGLESGPAVEMDAAFRKDFFARLRQRHAKQKANKVTARRKRK